MASIVAPLVSGISTAASGSVEFYRQGTSTAASVYSDAEGETAVTTHALDARGAIVRYVEDRVDVVVRNSSGATVTTFTWGTDARDARLENAGFTGPNASGQTVAGGRTTVHEALSDIFASLGATDGNVLVNGVSTALSTALSGSAGLVYNVKSAYGALGDGVTNDAARIQNAINAADAAGGGIIYFPHGTYLINSAITIANSTGKFFFLGEAASGTKLKQGTSGIAMLTLGNSNEQVLMNLTFTATAANTGTLVTVGSSARATFVSCSFEPLNGTTLAMAASGTSRANLIGCTIAQAGSSSRMLSGATAYVRFVGCDISTSGADLTSISDAVFVTSLGTNWTLGAAGAAGTTHVYNGAGGLFHVLGGELRCQFTSGTVNFCNAGALQIAGAIWDTDGATANLANSSLFEAACQVTGGSTVGAPTAGYSLLRNSLGVQTSGSATTYTPSGAYAVHQITSDGASMAIENPSPNVLPNCPLVILYKNTNAGPVTPTFGTVYTFTTTVAAVDSTKTGVYYFMPRLGNESGAAISTNLVCISPQPAGGITL
jgi:hypothetical protein